MRVRIARMCFVVVWTLGTPSFAEMTFPLGNGTGPNPTPIPDMRPKSKLEILKAMVDQLIAKIPKYEKNTSAAKALQDSARESREQMARVYRDFVTAIQEQQKQFLAQIDKLKVEDVDLTDEIANAIRPPESPTENQTRDWGDDIVRATEMNSKIQSDIVGKIALPPAPAPAPAPMPERRVGNAIEDFSLPKEPDRHADVPAVDPR